MNCNCSGRITNSLKINFCKIVFLYGYFFTIWLILIFFDIKKKDGSLLRGQKSNILGYIAGRQFKAHTVVGSFE
ncbi:hypothetical protein C4544_07410 [candidate division WS5 bacterium]|uniref:Uncharacterized protein n=1 Tax=candidate division WS5 bacterium TaxID=2093353 RepID=A0A419D9X9_9BACT|nr:MAG: hypothetical protein C4544_07410 [candidate division WS5 bacterium]